MDENLIYVTLKKLIYGFGEEALDSRYFLQSQPFRKFWNDILGFLRELFPF